MELASERKPKATPIVHPGTGVFTQRGKRAEVVPAAGGGGEISLNAVDTDLREVVKSVLGDTMGAPYVIDARVKGSVTMETSRPLPRAMLLPMLEEVLRLNGAALVKDNDVWHVVPLNEAAKSGLTSRLRSSAPRPDQAGHGLQVVPLRHVGASQMAKILEPFVPPDRVVRVEQARNLLILTGTRAELDSLLDLVDTFDVDWLQGMSFAMYPLASAQAGKLVAELEAVFGDTREGPLTGMIRFVPIERLNSILVISARPEYLKRVQSWIADLDKGGESDQRRLYVYNVKHGSAADLAGVLTQVFNPAAGAAGSGETLPSLAPGRSGGEIGSRGGSMFRGGGGGGSGGGFGGRGFNNNGGGAPGANGAIAANGHGSGAGSLAGMGGGMGGGEPMPLVPPVPPLQPMGPSIDAVGGMASPTLANVRVIADSRNNALLIMATPAEYKMVEQAVQRLDMVPLQVQIEATIVEVSLNDELRYGVQWFLKKGAGSFTLSDAASGAVAPIFPGFSFMAKHADMRVVLNALESITDVNVVSSPSLMVLDNRMARLQVGDEVPVATQSAMSVLNPEAPIVNTIAFRQTGVILEVTPHVNSGGMCILEITQEVSDVAQTVSSGIDSPTIRQRGVQSTVAVHSGETIALGGLIRDNRSRGQDGVPFLQHLPVIGAAFRSTNDNHARTELLVLLTPRVIRSMDEARQATEEMRRRMHSILPAEKQ